MAEREEPLGQHVGEYRLLRQLGKGSFGTVYLAQHLHSHSQFAVKLLRFHLTSPEDFKEFLNEARTMRLRHSHIVPLLDFGLTRDNTPYLVMEYAEGGTLRQHCRKAIKLPFETIDSYVTQLASALQYAHDHRVIHRDVKPQNVLLRADGTLLLSDFGIAKVLEQSSFISLQAQVGTPAYMAPEQSRGKPCPASDQYSLAVMVYEWLAGRLPFQGALVAVMLQHRVDEPPSLQKCCPEVPVQVEQVVMQALKKVPEERFSTVEQFAQTLHAAFQVSSATNLRTQPGDAPDRVAPPATGLHPSIHPASPPVSWVMDHPVNPAVSPQTALPQTVDATRSPVPSQGIPSIPLSERETWLPSARNKGISGRTLAITLLCCVLLVSLTGGGAWTYIKQQQQLKSQHATATVQASRRSATAQAISFATANAAASAYNKAIATNGIQFGFDAQRSHNNPYERILSPSNVKRLKRPAWTAGTDDIIYSSPAVANGVVYIGSFDGKLYAFKADGCGLASCGALWTAETEESVVSVIGVVGRSVVSSPAVANGVVYVSARGDGKLYAFKADGCGLASCRALWTAETGNSGSVIESSPAVANGVVYVGSGDHKLYAFKADGCGQASCGALWTAETGGSVSSSPAVANGVVYVGSMDHKLYAFKADGCGQASCAPLWTAETGDSVNSSPAVGNGVVYVGSFDHKLYAFKADGCGQASCGALWTAETGGSVSSSPAVGNGVVYVGSWDKKLYAFKADGCGQRSCASLWAAQTGGSVESSPAVANGVVYVGSGDHKLYAFKADGCGQASCAPLRQASLSIPRQQ